VKYITAFAAVFVIVYFIIPTLQRLSVRLNFVDKPTERKKHKSPIPLSGGISMFIGFIASGLIFIRPIDAKLLSIFAATALIIMIGILDDYYKTKGREFYVLPRIIIELLAAVLIFRAGIVFTGFTNPFSHEYMYFPVWLQFVLSILWIMGVTIVIGWTDGMDGLTGSIAAISGTTLLIAAIAKGQPATAMLAVLVVGAVLAFLRYNKPPAKVFMGDSGATFIGFILAIISLDGAFKQATVISILVPVLALGVPIFDNLWVVIRRIIEGRPIYKADAAQVHHRLLSSGLNVKQSLLFICLMCVCTSLLSIILLLIPG
jgi:UDP-N-acetylmuramyl pentapeptide phosphotransferase/UDP-N-acetylglucosamine-1-phosphate transferase